MPLYAATIEVW